MGYRVASFVINYLRTRVGPKRWSHGENRLVTWTDFPVACKP
jgi:hypothetical protein